MFALVEHELAHAIRLKGDKSKSHVHVNVDRMLISSRVLQYKASMQVYSSFLILMTKAICSSSQATMMVM